MYIYIYIYISIYINMYVYKIELVSHILTLIYKSEK